MGDLLSGIVVFRFAPDAQGYGTDAAVAAAHNPLPAYLKRHSDG